MEGRWQLMVTPDGRAPGAAKRPDEAAIRNGWSCTPVVPCDDAAVERAAAAYEIGGQCSPAHKCGGGCPTAHVHRMRLAFRAAGKTP